MACRCLSGLIIAAVVGCGSPAKMPRDTAPSDGPPATMDALVRSIRDRLPTGWKLQRLPNGALRVSRVAPPDASIPNASGDPEDPKQARYELVVRPGKRIDRARFDELAAANRRVQRRLTALKTQMAHERCDNSLEHNKLDLPCPARTQRQRRVHKQYFALRGQLVELPAGYVGDFASVFVSQLREPSDLVCGSCEALRRRVVKLLRPYRPATGGL